MERDKFVATLLSLLMAIDRGATEFKEPLPIEVEKGVVQAVVGFGGDFG